MLYIGARSCGILESMDILAGAEQLAWRIQCQQNWRKADAVRDGRQSPCDPHADSLAEISQTARVYVERDGRRWRKTIRDGWWSSSRERPATP